MAVEGVSKARPRSKKAKPPKRNKAEKLRLARFGIWAKNIDQDGDGKISRAELEARITARTAAGKPAPYARAVLDNLATLDKDATDGIEAAGRGDAAAFLAKTFKLGEKQAKKLDASA